VSKRTDVFIGREYLNGRLQYTKCRKIGRVVHDVDSVRSIHVLRFHRDMSSISRTKEFGSRKWKDGSAMLSRLSWWLLRGCEGAPARAFHAANRRGTLKSVCALGLGDSESAGGWSQHGQGRSNTSHAPVAGAKMEGGPSPACGQVQSVDTFLKVNPQKTNATLPPNVVCCVNSPGSRRYGVKMLFKTRQIRVGSRFIDPESAAHVANNFRSVVRIDDSGRFFIDEDAAARLGKLDNIVVKFFNKFSSSVASEHVLAFLRGWCEYMASRPVPKQRKRRHVLGARVEDKAKTVQSPSKKSKMEPVVKAAGNGELEKTERKSTPWDLIGELIEKERLLVANSPKRPSAGKRASHSLGESKKGDVR
jgi:hypothetical protein